MTKLLPWIVKAVLSGSYRFGCLYVATGLFARDGVTPDGIVASPPPVPPWLFAVLALLLHAALPFAGERLTGKPSR